MLDDGCHGLLTDRVRRHPPGAPLRSTSVTVGEGGATGIMSSVRSPGRPGWWPHFRSPLRSTAVTARLGRALGICFAVCFVTGMLSHYQYQPWSWLPEPASPGERLPGDAGAAHRDRRRLASPYCWSSSGRSTPTCSAGPRSSRSCTGSNGCRCSCWSPPRSSSSSTGFLNTLNWYPWPWSFPSTHRYLGYVVIGSILLHIGIKLPDIKYGLQAKLREADVLTEVPWNENPLAHSNAGVVEPPEDAGTRPAWPASSPPVPASGPSS